MDIKKKEIHLDRAINTILDLIWKNGPIARAELGRQSGYSRSTISLNCDSLLEFGILKEESLFLNGIVSKRKKLTISKDQGVVIGIELGAGSCTVGVCDIEATLLVSRSFTIKYALGPKHILELIYQNIDELLTSDALINNKLLGIGLGLPSPIDYSNGYAVHPAFMPGWHLFPIRDLLQSKYTCPVYIDNEVNMMALGESYREIEFRDKNLLFVKIGTAIGAGIIINGEIYRGNSGLGGNIGHMQINGNTEQCMCGKLGCLEAVTGGAALSRKGLNLALSGKSSFLKNVYQTQGTISAIDINNAANHGELEALKLIKESGDIIGSVIGKLVVFFDPKAVIIGGGLTGFGLQYMSYIRQGVLKQSSPWVKSDFIVRESQFGNKLGIIGASMLCVRELLSHGHLLKQHIL